MKYLLDTDICIFIIRRRPESVFAKLRKLTVGSVGISSITYSELYFGAYKSQNPEKNLSALETFTAPLEILPFDADAAKTYGKIRRQLEQQGLPIGPLDQLIAAHAHSLNLTLVSNNTREFSRVEGLRLENWLTLPES
ncbi:type II toxin-antitoxin system tRNA(fMet)-specific endonuclease VapC [Coraliomargarita sp. W4R72]